MNSDITRRLPFSLEAEQSVLGSILIDPQCIAKVAEIITSEDFYLENHANIYLAMQEMYLKNRDIDVVTLLDTLVHMGVYSEESGTEYIKLIAETVPIASNVVDYSKIVRDKSMLRKLIRTCEEISETCYSEQDDISHILDAAEQKIFALAQGNETKGFVHIRELLVGVHDHLRNLVINKKEEQGVQTGFSGLDRVLVGLGKSDLILIGARPGMGKTSFAMNIAVSVAQRTKQAVCVFSLEMSGEQLASRVLSSEALIDSYKMRSGELSDPEDWEKLAHASARLSECDIYVDDTTGITVTGMKAKLRRVRNLGLVVIDYLQLMQSDRRIDNRVQEVAEISRNLKLLAKELKVPVITCAQLSRGPESRTDKTPMLSDLRDSGAIEQDADVVMFLYRDDYYKDDPDKPNTASVIIAKNRHGSTGKVEMGWLGQYTKFTTIDTEHE